MPARTDLRSICVIGSGPIVIGQAAEFDYSGVQAVKALKQDGYRTILVNSNPATIMTDPGLADATYVEPLDVDVLARILEKERPDAVLPTVGGQTALNLALALEERGTLARLGIELIGASAAVIDRAEDREKFKACMDQIGLSSAKSKIAKSLPDARAIADEFGLPVVLRPSFTMGGSGGGIAHTHEELDEIVGRGLEQSPTSEVLVEECLLGWKEYELEVVRDRKDNVVIVCSIENVDPVGVHTGDSITVAPALTLSDAEYQQLRDAAIAILRVIGVETGGSNVQFAVNPQDGRVIVIEMNPRVSRSSALASKATGFPIAKVAAKLAVGYTLDEIENDITKKTKAAFEPAIDYVVVKTPRFAFEKFRRAGRNLTTQMKSVGEAMAIGRTFQEALGKVLRSLEVGAAGVFVSGITAAGGEVPAGDEALLEGYTLASPERLWIAAEALRRGVTAQTIADKSGIDPWFVEQLQEVIELEREIQAKGALADIDEDLWWRAKQGGLGDEEIGLLVGASAQDTFAARRKAGVTPVMKRVDTCAGEFEAHTPYLYSTYERPYLSLADDGDVPVTENEARPTDRQKVLILGSGPIRIGQGIEFDYCCVHAAQAVHDAGFESVMINCNPETVSTDYDTADRLYFEPLTLENVLEIAALEKPVGALIQFGGQTPLKLAQGLREGGVTVLGTNPDAVDEAEDRKKSAALVEKVGLRQPEGGTALGHEEAVALAEKLGFPVMIRPSYVLGGRAMEMVQTKDELATYLKAAVTETKDRPLLVDRFLDGATEVDVDVLSDGTRAIVCGVMEHVQEAGIHSGDSACVVPPYSLSEEIVQEIAAASRKLALELGVVGLLNAQFAVRAGTVFVIEVNPRASRTVPFLAKAQGHAWAYLAARLALGMTLDELGLEEPDLLTAKDGHVCVKEAVLPFHKFPGVDPILGPEMRSTGEVMGIDVDYASAYAKSQVAAGVKLPTSGTVLVSIADHDKEPILDAIERLHRLGFIVLATGGTHRFLQSAGIFAARVNKLSEGAPNLYDHLVRGDVALVFNTALGSRAQQESAYLRRAALTAKVPYYTTVSSARAASLAIERMLNPDAFALLSLQDRFAASAGARPRS